MPNPINEIRSSLPWVLNSIESSIYKNIAVLNMTIWKTQEPVPFQYRMSGEKRSVAVGETWGNLWDCAWFHFEGQVPSEAAGKKVALLIDISGEACIFDENGCPIQGLTNVNSEFDFTLGRPGKRVVDVADCSKGNEVIDFWADAGCNDLFGKYQDSGKVKEANIALCNEEMRKLYYDFEVLLELMNNLPEGSARYYHILYSLNKASLILNDYTEEEAIKAREVLAPELNKKGGDPSLSISAIGHAHIDLAWLWPIRETRRKAARTFSTVLKNMEKYNDYIFGASQPQLYAWVKQDYPALYAKVKERIEEGRWEAQGGMWVEADTNLSGGESMVRQFLYGKKFFKEEFNKDMKILWLPDVFGYSGALPQIMKKSGIEYFMTIKLSWNTYNRFPHHTFMWSGIDGSTILAHMPPEGTYNSSAAPRAIRRAEEEYLDKGISENCLMLFGIGDGGGGPGEEHLERLSREKNLAGLLPVSQEKALDFFEKLNIDKSQYNSWNGELYLEKHQGTYTTQSLNKRYNRKCELALRDLEFLAALTYIGGNNGYPKQLVEDLWKEVLLYQFHDILPGSSIKRVYDETSERYLAILDKICDLQEDILNKLVEDLNTSDKKRPSVIYNSLSWQRNEWFRTDKGWLNITVPSMGYKVVDLEDSTQIEEQLTASSGYLENDLLQIRFNSDGTIKSVYDKENSREAIAYGHSANNLLVYIDKGDAWDFSIQYSNRPMLRFMLQTSECYTDGPKAKFRQIYTFGNSVFEQVITLTAGSRRIDFDTTVDWYESGKMLRADFPLNIFTGEVTCDIQFGNIKRPVHKNTSMDMAMYEICAHKWVDLSEPGFGVSLINDCKYGHSVNGNTISLNLLRSTNGPGKNADRGRHRLIYSLYPHKGSYIEGHVYKEAYQLNIPLIIKEIEPNNCSSICNIPKSFINISEKNILLETVKPSEEGHDIIVRLYECYGMSTSARLEFDSVPKAVKLTDLMERGLQDLDLHRGSLDIEFKPFEIKTMRLIY